MPYDFKKEQKEFYLPKAVPEIVEVPPISYVAVRGEGDPNDFSSFRLHHEIYLSDPRKNVPEKQKTVIRHPVKKA